MKRIFLIASLLAVCPAFADDAVARFGADYVRLMRQPCTTAEVLAQIQPEHHDKFQAAVSLVDGKSFRGCWVMLPNGAVFLQYEDADSGLVPRELFKSEPGV